MDLLPLQDSIQGLCDDVQAFKFSQEQRLNQLEGKMMRPVLEHPQQVHDYTFKAFLRGDGMDQKALSTSGDGAFCLPKVIVERLTDYMNELSVMRKLANVMEISSSNIELLLNKTRPHVGWVAETKARDETQSPELRRIIIEAHEMYANPRATQKLLDDTEVDVEDWLLHSIADAMARAENAAFISGDGTGKPKGFLTTQIATAARATEDQLRYIATGVKGAFKSQEGHYTLIETVYSVSPELLTGASWLMSRSAVAAVRKLKDHKTMDPLWQAGSGLGGVPTLLGYPVYVSDDMPALQDDAYGVAFGNFKEAYQIVDRMPLQVTRDPFSSKPFVEFYVTKRVGGELIRPKALTVVKFGEN